jgi:hypothetical protein
MNRKFGVGVIVGSIVGTALVLCLKVPEVHAQKARGETHWEYKVGWFSYNPGERMDDEARRLVFERNLNERARDGWEPVEVILNRTTVQSVGGSMVTRDTVSFVAFRRPKQ